jgi:type VI secretion system secreted protein Hcp
MACDNFVWFPAPASGGLLKGDAATQPQGESADKWFSTKKAFECTSITFGVTQAETTGSAATGSGAGKAKFDEFQIEKFVDLASVPLYQACCAGAHFPTICLAIRKAGGSNLIYVQYMFRMVFVTSISWTGGDGEAAPKETIKFKYGALGLQYVRQKADGGGDKPYPMYWSNVTNKPELIVPGLAAPPDFIPVSQA